jgi:hypothetical protein
LRILIPAFYSSFFVNDNNKYFSVTLIETFSITCHQMPSVIQKHMPEPKLSIRYSKSLKLARSLAKKDRLTVSQVLERALELYANVELEREAAPDFYARIAREYRTDLDLDILIREDSKPSSGIDL